MIFVGDGALLQSAVRTAADRGHPVDAVFGGTPRTAAFCHQHALVFEPVDVLRTDPHRLARRCTDGIGFSIDNAAILPAAAVRALSIYGIHAGIVPHQRGNPVVATIFAILEGAPEYGVTLFRVDEGIDSGEVLSIERFAITPRSHLHEVLVASALLCQRMFEAWVDRIARGAFTSAPIPTDGTRPYRRKDLKRLVALRDHPDFDRATDLGVLDGALPLQDVRFLAELRASPSAADGWRRRLPNVARVWFPPCDDPVPGRARSSFPLAVDTGGLAAALGTSDQTVRLAAFLALLARYTGVGDPCVATAGTEGAVALRVDLTDRPGGAALCRRVASALAEVEPHAVPLRVLAAAIPLDVGFGVDGDLDQIWTVDAGTVTVDYDTTKLDASSVARLVAHYGRLLAGIVADQETPVPGIEMLSKEERRTMLVDWNATTADYRRDRCIHDVIGEALRERPDAIAVIAADGTTLTARALTAQANRLARELVARGVGRDVCVAVGFEPGPQRVIGVLAVLRAGGAFVPFDAAVPEARVALILAEARVRVVVTDRALAEGVPAGPWARVVLDDAVVPDDDTDLPARARPEDLAYVVYTSGSTGRPKGVMVEHRGLYNTIVASQWVHPMILGERFLALAPFSADTAVWQLLAPLCWGGTVVLGGRFADPADIVARIDAHRVTTVELVPSLLRAVLEEVERAPDRARSLTTLISSGESLTAPLLGHAVRSLPHCAVYDSYGPTETASQVTYHRRIPGRPATIGVPIPHTRIYVLDGDGNPVPIGVTGEITLGGAGVARGYLHRPDLTAQRFVPDPFAEGRMYRTGDLGRFRADGEVVFLGRDDDQVKVRGHRVEPGEVAAVLATFPGVDDAIVGLVDDRLVAWLLVRNGVEADAVRAHVRRQLPAHMVPNVLIGVEAWPLTAAGKVDRRALAALGREERGTAEEDPPARTQVEATLARIWASVLGRATVGVRDDFYELGGHSLLAIRLVSEIRSVFDAAPTLGTVADHPTIERMAAWLSSASRSSPTRVDLLAEAVLPPEIALVGAPTGGRAVLVTGATGFLGRHLVRALLEHTDRPIRCLVRANGPDQARERLRVALARAGASACGRVEGVVGDLTVPRFGLTPDGWAALVEEVGVVYHLGAVVNHLVSYAALRVTNVSGTLEVLRFAMGGAAVHFGSSVEVTGGGEALRVPEPPADAEGYTASKWVADQLVAAAADRGIPVCIHRTGYVGPDAVTGDANDAGWFERYLRAMWVLGAVPDEIRELAWTPVGAVVGAMVAQIDARGALHLVHAERVVTRAAILTAAARLGRRLLIVPGPVWREQLAKWCAARPADPLAIVGPYLDATGSLRTAPVTCARAAAEAPIADVPPEDVVAAFLRSVRT